MSLSDDAKELGKLAKRLEIAGRDGDPVEFQKVVGKLSQLAAAIPGRFESARKEVESELETLQPEMPGYYPELEGELRNNGCDFTGAFPEYSIFPCVLKIRVQEKQAELSLGRTVRKTTKLRPAVLAKWAKQQSIALQKVRFNREQFMKNLRKAYELATQLQYGETADKWDRPASLHRIYELLAGIAAGKQGYPREQFESDLTRLANGDPMIDVEHGLTFELGYSRSQSGTFLIRRPHGAEERVKTLTIYNKKR
ncbi:hypothetical protein HS125_17695 [bacterium]|nr:hypothetical protein [bacterium]